MDGGLFLYFEGDLTGISHQKDLALSSHRQLCKGEENMVCDLTRYSPVGAASKAAETAAMEEALLEWSEPGF